MFTEFFLASFYFLNILYAKHVSWRKKKERRRKEEVLNPESQFWKTILISESLFFFLSSRNHVLFWKEFIHLNVISQLANSCDRLKYKTLIYHMQKICKFCLYQYHFVFEFHENLFSIIFCFIFKQMTFLHYIILSLPVCQVFLGNKFWWLLSPDHPGQQPLKHEIRSRFLYLWSECTFHDPHSPFQFQFLILC